MNKFLIDIFTARARPDLDDWCCPCCGVPQVWWWGQAGVSHMGVNARRITGRDCGCVFVGLWCMDRQCIVEIGGVDPCR